MCYRAFTPQLAQSTERWMTYCADYAAMGTTAPASAILTRFPTGGTGAPVALYGELLWVYRYI